MMHVKSARWHQPNRPPASSLRAIKLETLLLLLLLLLLLPLLLLPLLLLLQQQLILLPVECTACYTAGACHA